MLDSITERVTGRVTVSLGKSRGESLQELLPMSSRPVTKLWASHFWESCTGSKSLGDGVLRQVTRQVNGRVAPDLKPPSEKWSARKLLGEGVSRQVTGRVAPCHSVTKLLRTSNVLTARERERKFPISWANNGVHG
jgi:hypothetical protein